MGPNILRGDTNKQTIFISWTSNSVCAFPAGHNPKYENKTSPIVTKAPCQSSWMSNQKGTDTPEREVWQENEPFLLFFHYFSHIGLYISSVLSLLLHVHFGFQILLNSGLSFVCTVTKLMAHHTEGF